ncbi:type II secretion system F family protein [Vibrio cincinnatiensis]|jgi:MSHA biogenesis protein MshG|uniref:MSHA biogenesis protein MshG n=1 Tax=Vibrio cincinnatiensis DSM 19608 TaxID=1123491 RepID=A0A1T4QGF1_VIBCI|nr:type II secretion system F family protein [Vibrio cincinnatiensis]MCG3721791.1 type II secretion system F family protein [Vibrio cincinnatiensis]MCG3726905.1 type II secretion system F family protein [Vibrio cincinnatiensis]MCG3733604.1 type II secretion system F family protein [Vibrio cincinnatiensis]MCG3741452.1 type II secretion system F family protein [Vibrio cincinnatiensis]SKA02358.1 MSHA biogenesis protein MshG [Vibrio cincinnatiensis DSM 19608]
MPSYQYLGRNADGSKASGSVDAPSEDMAAETLLSQGVIPTSIVAKKSVSAPQMDWKAWFAPAVPLEVLVIFCRQMYSLTKAGVPLLRSMRGLTQNCTNKQLQQALEDVAGELTNGRGLSASMQMHPQVFSPLFVSMINVGENTGRLDQALLQLANYYEQEVETRKRIKTAMRYPTFVISFIGIAMFILNIKVIPQFATMFNRFGVELPLPTRILIGMSNFFVNYWMAIIGAIVGGIFAFRSWLGTPKGREKWDKFRLRMPIVGGIVNRAQLARFSRTFSLMLKSGVPLNQSLALSAEALENKFLESRLLKMKGEIEAGSSVSVTAMNADVFTPLVIQMIAVGEETGRIDELLLEVADFYDREVDYDLKTLTARIEPILLVIVAGMVLILALGIFLPMWGMLDAIKG